MSAYRAVTDLRDALDGAQQAIDRHHDGDGEWMARASLCRYLVGTVASWAREIPADGDAPADGENNSFSRLANEVHRMRLENERLRGAIAIIETTLEAIK